MVTAVAKLAGLSRQYVQLMAMEGVLTTTCRLGGNVLIAEEEALAWIAYREARMRDRTIPEQFPNPHLVRTKQDLPVLKGWMIVAEIAPEAGISQQWVQRRARDRKFKVQRKVGRQTAVPTREAKKYLAARQARLDELAAS